MIQRLALLPLVLLAVAPAALAAEPAGAHFLPEFTNRSIVRVGDNLFLVRDPLIFRLSGDPVEITVPAGFVTDLASIPKKLHWWEGKVDRSMPAAIVHDYLYWYGPCTRAEADAVLWLGMRTMRMSNSKVKLVYRGVRRFGKGSYDENSELRRGGQIRTLLGEQVSPLVAQGTNPDEKLDSLLARLSAAGHLVQLESSPESVKAACSLALTICKSCDTRE